MKNTNQLSVTFWNRLKTPNQFQLPGKPPMPEHIRMSVSVSGGLSSSGLTDYSLQRQHRATVGMTSPVLALPSGESFVL